MGPYLDFRLPLLNKNLEDNCIGEGAESKDVVVDFLKDRTGSERIAQVSYFRCIEV